MKKIILYAIVGIMMISLATASITTDIDIPNSFLTGEIVSFDYSIISDLDQEIIYILHVICPNAPVAFLQEKTIQLQANQPYTATYSDQVVQDWFESQTCTAYVQILSPIQKIVSKNFTIVTDPAFDFSLTFDKKVFTQGENMYLDYESDISGLGIDATLTYPDDSTESLNLPTTIKAEQIGTYDLKVTASKQDYKTVSLKEQFGVIESEASIETESSEASIETISSSGFIKNGIKQTDKNEIIIYSIYGILIVGVLVLIFWIVTFILSHARKREQQSLKENETKKYFKKVELSKEGPKKTELFKSLKSAGFKGEEDKFLKGKVNQEIRNLLVKARQQLSEKDKSGAKETYRKIRKLYSSLKKSERNKELYKEISIFYKKLMQ